MSLIARTRGSGRCGGQGGGHGTCGGLYVEEVIGHGKPKKSITVGLGDLLALIFLWGRCSYCFTLAQIADVVCPDSSDANR